MSSILITKEDPQKSFRQPLEKEGHIVQDISFLDFRPITFSSIPEADCIFFYSKRGVHFFFEQLLSKDISVPSNVLWAALGESTATAVKSYTNQVDFTGSGKPTDTLDQFRSWFSGQKVLAIRADQSLNRLESLEDESWELVDLVVYSNEIKESINFDKHDVVVLTSPLNTKAYFQFQKDAANIIIAIGQTTASAVKQFTNQKVFVSPKPYLSEVAAFTLKVINDNS